MYVSSIASLEKSICPLETYRIFLFQSQNCVMVASESQALETIIHIDRNKF